MKIDHDPDVLGFCHLGNQIVQRHSRPASVHRAFQEDVLIKFCDVSVVLSDDECAVFRDGNVHLDVLEPVANGGV